MNIVEGYTLANCNCGQEDTLSFVETEYKDQKRFLVVCSACGEGTTMCPTKENAVHIWNKHHNLLLG